MTLAITMAVILASCTTSPPRGRRGVDLAESQLATGNALGAIASADSTLATGTGLGPADAVRAHLVIAEGNLALGNFAVATNHFRAASTAAATPSHRARISRGLGDTRYRQRDFAGAREQYKLTLGQALTEVETREIYYRLAVCSRALGHESEALAYRSRAGSYRPDPRDPLTFESVQGGARPPVIASSTLPRSSGDRPVVRPVVETRPEASETYSYSGRMPQILPRSAWGAKSTRRNSGDMGRIRLITVHHSGEAYSSRSQADAARAIKGVQAYHQSTKGWADIAYHYVVDPAGRIWEGRPISVRGAHAGDRTTNTGNVGIMLLGNFNEQRPTREQLSSLTELVGWVRETYRLPASSIKTHGEVREEIGAGTECPGTNLAPFVATLRAGGGGRSQVARARTYEVQKGDTLFSIAQDRGVSQQALLTANPGLSASTLQAGARITLPR